MTDDERYDVKFFLIAVASCVVGASTIIFLTLLLCKLYRVSNNVC